MNELNKIYDKLGDKIESLVQLYKSMQKLSLSSEEIAKAVKCGTDLPVLELKYENLKDEVKQIEDQKQNLISEIENLESTTSVLKHTITNLDRVLEHRTNKVKLLDCKVQKLRNMILWMMESKEYKKIKDIAHQQAETTLKDKRAILLVALVAVIEAFKLDPKKQILNCTQPNDGVNQIIFYGAAKKGIIGSSRTAL
jgi:chromosome segregation ATPase